VRHVDREQIWNFEKILDATRREVSVRLTEFLSQTRQAQRDDPAEFEESTASDLVKEFFDEHNR
jgi:hypothetical protein